MKINSHGGNIYKKSKELGIKADEILDFSANISPLGLPDSLRQAMVSAIDGVIHYPDPECLALREQISLEDQVGLDTITCGNGGADLLYRLAYGLKPSKVLLPVPAFVEYEEAMTASGAEFVFYEMGPDMQIREDILDDIREDIDLIILCNPNNPTGLLTPRTLVEKIAKKASKVGAYLLIDECFLELTSKEKDYTMLPYTAGSQSKGKKLDHLLILKSFTKLYAIPGIRLGYLVGPEEVIEKVNRAGQAWSVSSMAQSVGLAALKERAYKQAVIEEVEKELAYMKEALKTFPIQLYDGNVNYLFFRAPGIEDLDRRLEQKGILIRNCKNYRNLGPDYWRVAVRKHEDNQRLIEALRELPIWDKTEEGEG